MRCPTITDLPSPPRGKIGWPWTKETPHLPNTMPNGSHWPRLSVVTPSYNQGAFIEETIRSVLLQGYPNLEYIIIDGGSADDTLAILKKYSPFLSYWRSEPDDGQSAAIDIGLSRGSGTISAYINSDDYYLRGALEHVASVFDQTACDVLVGRRRFGYNGLRPFRRSWWITHMRPFAPPFALCDASKVYGLPQECVFWRSAKHSLHSFDPTLQFCMDLDWFSKIIPGSTVVHTTRRLAAMHLHNESKTARLSHVWAEERARILERIASENDRFNQIWASGMRAEFATAERRGWLRQFLPGWEPIFKYRHPGASCSAAARRCSNPAQVHQ
jgi:glycosyltransferase involved in cell wall biosynthesis